MGKFSGDHTEAFLKRAEDESHRGNKAMNHMILNDNAAKELESWNMARPTAHYKHMFKSCSPRFSLTPKLRQAY